MAARKKFQVQIRLLESFGRGKSKAFAFPQKDVLVMQGSERKAEWPGTKNTLNDARLGSASFMLIFLIICPMFVLMQKVPQGEL